MAVSCLITVGSETEFYWKVYKETLDLHQCQQENKFSTGDSETGDSSSMLCDGDDEVDEAEADSSSARDVGRHSSAAGCGKSGKSEAYEYTVYF